MDDHVKITPDTIKQMGDPRGKDATWTLMPVDTSDGRCSQCATQHDPREAHNQESLAYRYSFYAEHDRWPTWEDAIAHCAPERQEAWRQALREHGVDI